MNTFQATKALQKKIQGIPKKNKEKFFNKFIQLLDDAYKEDF